MSDETAPPATPEPPEASSPDPLQAAWAQVEANWDDPSAHKRFLTLASTLGRLKEAGAHYRVVRDGDPARSDEARRQIDALFALAMASLEVLKSPAAPKNPPIVLMIAAGMCFVLLGAAVFALLRGS